MLVLERKKKDKNRIIFIEMIKKTKSCNKEATVFVFALINVFIEGAKIYCLGIFVDF